LKKQLEQETQELINKQQQLVVVKDTEVQQLTAANKQLVQLLQATKTKHETQIEEMKQQHARALKDQEQQAAKNYNKEFETVKKQWQDKHNKELEDKDKQWQAKYNKELAAEVENQKTLRMQQDQQHKAQLQQIRNQQDQQLQQKAAMEMQQVQQTNKQQARELEQQKKRIDQLVTKLQDREKEVKNLLKQIEDFEKEMAQQKTLLDNALSERAAIEHQAQQDKEQHYAAMLKYHSDVEAQLRTNMMLHEEHVMQQVLHGNHSQYQTTVLKQSPFDITSPILFKRNLVQNLAQELGLAAEGIHHQQQQQQEVQPLYYWTAHCESQHHGAVTPIILGKQSVDAIHQLPVMQILMAEEQPHNFQNTVCFTAHVIVHDLYIHGQAENNNEDTNYMRSIMSEQQLLNKQLIIVQVDVETVQMH